MKMAEPVISSKHFFSGGIKAGALLRWKMWPTGSKFKA
jgi:hypothetical protein